MARPSLRSLLASSAAIALALGAFGARPAEAQTQAPVAASSDADVVVTARKLSAARASIQPQVGASTYTIDAQAIQNLPAGANAPLNQVVLQAPGAVQDSFGQLHIRGEHNGLQFRLNGVILPEGLSVFSQALSPRLAGQVELITGALPAEYGLRTAGIIDITTKTGDANGGEVSIYGGSHGEIEPSFEYGGRSGNTSFYVSGSYLADDLGIESPDGRSDPIHDRTQQFQGFAYLNHIIDAQSQVSLILGASNQRFQIPDVSGQTNGGLGLTVLGQTDFPSQDINENQTESTEYGVVSYLRTSDRFTSQISVFARYSALRFTPDEIPDILFNGVSQAADKTDLAGGVQAEAAYHLNDAHTLRGGVIVEVDRSTSKTRSNVLLIDNNPASPTFGSQLSDQPFTIVDNGSKTAETYSAYIQDEWKLAPNLTLNYGVRFDQFDGFRDENQVSPRVNAVWLPTPSTTIHAGYARYFSPPPFELIASESVAKFVAPTGNPRVTSSAAPSITTDTTPFAERADYFDVGAAQKLTPALIVTVDAYFKISRHLIDEGQFGAPIVLTPFNYQDGRQYGVEFTLSYNKGPLAAYANLAAAEAQGRDWISSQFNFDQASLDYVATHFIYLDHNESLSASAGASYLWMGTRLGFDLIYGSGLRTDGPLATPITFPDGSVLTAIPNGGHTAPYLQVNLALSHRFETAPGGPYEVRLDVVNLFDKVYEIRDGSGVGVFASQFGPRRGVFVGLTKEFQ
ncbi:MAG TPA: TonB-dependent receptor [Caulobacteraceae bacterium]|nr:TonB-dependent receptor [Caulobacteraceae bacterium]